jgi:hypothetical protein
LQLSTDAAFHEILGIRNLRSNLYKEMRDAEFVLRFLTFRNSWQFFTGGMARHMDAFMVANQRAPVAQLDDWTRDFLHTLDRVRILFGEHAFQRWEPDRQSWRKQVLAALYDAEMFAARDLEVAIDSNRRPAVLEGLKQLFENESFRRSVDAATNTPSYFRERVTLVREMLHNTLMT